MKEDHGSHGCSVDALSHLDHICSGKQTCSLDIPDEALHKMQTCPKEIMSYLEADYSCVKGIAVFVITSLTLNFEQHYVLLLSRWILQ